MRTKFLILLALFLYVGINVMADEKKNESVEPIDIIIRTDDNNIHRGIIPNPTVLYYSFNDSIELTCFDLGIVNVYILDSSGLVVAAESFNSDFTPVFSINAPTISGVYWLIIDSPAIYAEGSFTVN